MKGFIAIILILSCASLAKASVDDMNSLIQDARREQRETYQKIKELLNEQPVNEAIEDDFSDSANANYQVRLIPLKKRTYLAGAEKK